MQMGGRGLRAWAEVCTSKVLVWSRVCGEVGLVGQQMNQVLRRVSKDSNRDRKLNEMDRGDSHFIQKQNLRELKKKNPTTLLPFGTLPFYCSGMDRESDPRCVTVKEVSPPTACEYHTLKESKLSQCPVFEVFKKKL